MSFSSFAICKLFGFFDNKRDKKIPIPQGVEEICDISYGPNGVNNLLNVYYPKGTTTPLPTIVNIHGGGYVYGTKEVYHRYCMDLAKRGFTVVSFNYRLAPVWEFPTPLVDTNAVLTWMCENSEKYNIDLNNLILVGDSAGAQLSSQYAAIWANPDYAKSFDFKVPEIQIRALGLNCGLYDLEDYVAKKRRGNFRDYFGKELSSNDHRVKVLDNINENYPPAYIATAHNDFLKKDAQPMFDLLNEKGVACEMKCYGTIENKKIGHIFHINLLFPEAKECNDAECNFFKKFLDKEVIKPE